MLDNRSDELHSLIESDDWRQCERPTIVGVVITPSGKVIMVQPRNAQPNGWIFPQGHINRGETLLESTLREVEEELGYDASILDVSKAKFIGKGAAKELHGKQYFVVALPLQKWQKPKLNRENRQYCTVGGPGELAKKVVDCSQTKKRLIQLALRMTIREGLLYSQRWKASHANILLSSL
jgi:ADP-ribose pyrophosphatase YjhB (NUDIX family)